MDIKTGDNIFITYKGRTVGGRILFASTNKKSLFLSFDAMLGGYCGMMAVLLDDAGVYRDLFEGHEVTISTERDHEKARPM